MKAYGGVEVELHIFCPPPRKVLTMLVVIESKFFPVLMHHVVMI